MDRVPKAKYSFSSSLFPSSIETNKGTHAAEILGPASEIVTPSEMLSDDRWPEELENNGEFDSFFRVYSYTRATTSNRGCTRGLINARKSVSIGSGNYDAVAVRDTLYYGVAIVLAKSPGMKL